jgi:hypothetical protein
MFAGKRSERRGDKGRPHGDESESLTPAFRAKVSPIGDHSRGKEAKP